MKFPFATIVHIERASTTPIYLQIARSLADGIQRGLIKPGMKLPSTREFAVELKVNRNTVANSFAELEAQGLVKTTKPTGSFVRSDLKKRSPQRISAQAMASVAERTGFQIKPNILLSKANILDLKPWMLEFDEGLPDVRLAPLIEFNRAYRNVAKRVYTRQNLSYSDPKGNKDLRIALSQYLNATRGLKTTDNNILITRGSQMALYLTVLSLVQPGENVIVGSTNYFLVDRMLLNVGAKLIRVPVDEHGLDVEVLESLCKKKKIRAVYITPHHHYPTTVTMIAERRIKLLSLAEEFRFCIIEDDYDYDFHYASDPILPLASADRSGMVVYIGSLFKSIAPALRVGFLIAPINLIDEALKYRRLIDLQGDPMLEQSTAEMMKSGEIARHMKKAVYEYHKRRDHLASLLQSRLANAVNFKVPDGGMAIWARFDKKINLKRLSEETLRRNLIISDGNHHNTDKVQWNATRMGFASLNSDEAEKAVRILVDSIEEMR